MSPPLPPAHHTCLCSLGTLGITTVLKRAIGRIRPAPHVLPPRLFNLRSLEKNHSMPSGDSAQAGMFLMMLALGTGQPAWLLAVPATMFGRCYFGCHWIGDTIAGSTMGAAVAATVAAGTAAVCESERLAGLLPNLCSTEKVAAVPLAA
jgi:membrane-associated phospholipid phosphatase